MADIPTVGEQKVKNDVWNLMGFLNKINPNARQYVQKIENAIKSIVLKQNQKKAMVHVNEIHQHFCLEYAATKME